MQFYTLPRIIQWFGDTETARPELLMFCATVFLMIGPCVFWSFVWRAEVLKLVKNRLKSIKSVDYLNRLAGRANSYGVNESTTVSSIGPAGMYSYSNATYSLTEVSQM